MSASRGFTVIEIILICATVAVVGFVGFAIYQASQDIIEVEPSLIDATPVINNDIPEDIFIDSREDLDEAEELLESLDIGREMESDQRLEAEAEAF